jgi:hypothetical protein
VRRLVALAAVLVAGVALALGGSASRSAPREPRTSAIPAVMPAADARSTAWFCAAGPAALRTGRNGRERLAAVDELISIGNLADRPQNVRITVVADGRTVATRRVDVDARSVAGVRVRDLTNVRFPGTIVESFDGPIVVEQGYSAGSDTANTPCATDPSTRWYFPAGSTRQPGSQEWITLFNPFGDDAIVDFAFDTSAGRVTRGALSGLAVPRRSVLAIPLHDHVLREDWLATQIQVTSGRVFAAQALRSGGSSTLTLGAVAPARSWTLAGGRGSDTRQLTITNPGDVDAPVDISVITQGPRSVEPQSFTVARRSSVVRDLGDLHIPARVRYALVVRSAATAPIVVADLATWSTDAMRGAVSTVGSPVAAREWSFARSRFAGATTTISIANPGTRAATVSIRLVGGGRDEVMAGGDRIEVPAASQLTLRVQTSGADAAMVVSADVPVVVERATASGEGVTRTAGVPLPPER